MASVKDESTVLLLSQNKQNRTNTHTCSEIAYRITDVECIVRAKTPQLNLTGSGE
jgi:hypothetical protein